VSLSLSPAILELLKNSDDLLQKVVSISIDCDGDAILFQVEQEGSACHTGEFTCFHREIYPAKDENN